MTVSLLIGIKYCSRLIWHGKYSCSASHDNFPSSFHPPPPRQMNCNLIFASLEKISLSHVIDYRKKCPGVYLIVAKAVPFAASAALSYLTTVHSAILIRSQLEYDRGREYTDSGHVFILAISHAHRYAYTSAVHSARVRIHSQRYTLCQRLHRPSLQSCQVQVLNYAPRGMSLLETSSQCNLLL